MYVGMIETRSLKILLKSSHENFSDMFKKIVAYLILNFLSLTCMKLDDSCAQLLANTCNIKAPALLYI